MKSRFLVGMAVVSSVMVFACTSKETDDVRSSPAGGGVEDSSEVGTTGFFDPLSREAVSEMMQSKESYCEEILGGLVEGDGARITRAADAMHQVSLKAEWEVHGDARYAELSEAFRGQLKTISDHAMNDRFADLPHAYSQMTLTCMECHGHIKSDLKND